MADWHLRHPVVHQRHHQKGESGYVCCFTFFLVLYKHLHEPVTGASKIQELTVA
jgi:hypothetical protein